MNVGIYIYEQAEVLDFSGPFEVFSTASRLYQRPGLFNVFLVAETAAPVKARAGYTVLPAYGFEKHPGIDVLVVAGGVHQGEMKKTEVMQWLKHQAQETGLIASVCTGVFLLAQAGIVTRQQVTTHHQDISELKSLFPALEVVENVRWTQSGNILTSAGIAAGIDMSLHLVSELAGSGLAEKTADQMEFFWRKQNNE
ncbi:DJ-1/PfpI family protein [Thalassomonas haliotis]|uniref:DJ-1/PfpI family protein n=1 Tax=Thalassomonas haliotis TaxID=485448 RepID=A0ABY7VLG2_9GAMM|nr:DJ-1/PfpI family protein [Thalassomonas haliotis]WDE14600.1 DJ-1/PfpI family protein [Thalassomonas haliotis]